MSTPESIESSSDSAIVQLLASLHKSTLDENTIQHPASEHSNHPTRTGTPESDPEIIIISPTHTPPSQPEEADRNTGSALEDFEFIQPQFSQPEASTQPIPVPKKSKKSKRKESKKEKKNKKVTEDLVDEELAVEELVDENLVAKDPVTEELVPEQPIVEEPIVEEPTAKESIVEESIPDNLVIEELVTEDHIAKETFDSGPAPDTSGEVIAKEEQEFQPNSEILHIENHPESHEIEKSDIHQDINTLSSNTSLEEAHKIDLVIEEREKEQESEPVIEVPEVLHQSTEEIPINTELICDQFENISPEQEEDPIIIETESVLNNTSHQTEEEIVLDQNADLNINPHDQPNHEPFQAPEQFVQDSNFPTFDLHHSDFQDHPESQEHSEIQDHIENSKLSQEINSIPETQELDCVFIPEIEETVLKYDNSPDIHTPTEETSEVLAVEDEYLFDLSPTSQHNTEQRDLSEADRDIIVEDLTAPRPQFVAEIVRSINEKSVGEEIIQPALEIQGISSGEPVVVVTGDLVPEPSIEQELIVAEPDTITSLEETVRFTSQSPTLDLIIESTPFVHHIEPVAAVRSTTKDFIQEPQTSEYASTIEDCPENIITPPLLIHSNEQLEEPIAEISNDTSNMALQDRSLIASQLSDALALFNSFDESVKSLVNSLQSNNNPLITKPEQEASSLPATAVFQVPYPRNVKFHGRFSLLSRMLGMWRPQQRCRIAVAGLGGFGKTELVLEFVYRAREVSPNTPVFWFGPDNIRSRESPASAVAGLQLENWLRGQQYPNSMLVVDSGDRSGLFESSSDRGSFIDCLRNFQGTVILISRNGRDCNLIASPHEVFEVRELELDACVKVMCDHLEVYAQNASTEREMQQLIKSLGLHPRAILQVTKVINSTQMTVSQFYEMYSSCESFQLRLFSNIDPYSRPNHDMSVIGRGIFDLRSFRKSHADQSRLLYQIYYLGGKAVPSSLVTTNDPLNKILLMLIVRAHFMINEDVFNDTLSIHPMVYLAMRKALGSERSLADEIEMLEERKWKDEVVVKFSKHYPTDTQADNRKWWNDCFAHLINGYNRHSDVVKISVATIYQRESAFLKRKGVFSEALKMAKLARDALPDPVPSEGLVIVQDQITLLDFLARYREVHELLRGLTMEAGHSGNLWKKSMMAKLEVADCANRYNSAIDIFRQVRTAGEAANVDKLDLANATDDLSMALMQKGKYREAATECRKALAERSSRLGNSHTDTLSSSHNLAEILHRDGKFEEATRHIQDAIHGRETALGAEHPETLYSKVLKARIQISRATTTGEFDEAESIFKRAVEKLSADLLPSHPIVMTCKSEIAQIMFARGKYETAEVMNQSILAMRSTGPWLDSATHPDTMTSRNQLVDIIRLKDGCKAADNLSERCLTERTVVLTNGSLTGDDFHPDQLSSLHNRAVILSGLGQHLAALQKIDLALLGRKAILGERHPDYFISMTWKGEIMRAQLHRYQSERTQTLDTIENLHKQAYEGLSWIFGSEHQSSLQCATHMALAKRERGSPSNSEAEGLFRQIHCAYQHNMGNFHPETLKSKGRLAEAMRATSPRHHAEAKKLWRDSCGGLTRIYGFDAHITANAYKGYEKFLRTYPDP